ncbi:hypothetical protein KBY24_15770 [Ruegeria pomeroyi]|uniref:Uncharacterized protein n=1 Tax=Ruegeria alba TaxID=2916756 RepID=A0ABS9NWY0_9RHOB|nr:hypothetical protein [Ruegeria alba]MCE8513304.1 hypothetical protein [Ruegeria pomeroyi]MCE8522521.1 hypothetical protein [Ruegeria pomeroyi]MCE8530047.1 hypothetical protein [Ruegeria pomeroyi]MCE8534846.1 hypothetical protein [Ruegeria pomeroyi]MCE8545371.1 hypothetical protein [Ruegeria pomeroyi]
MDKADFPFRYALSVQGVLLGSLDVTTTGALSENQFDWLDDLLECQASRHKSVVLFSHLPLWLLPKSGVMT